MESDEGRRFIGGYSDASTAAALKQIAVVECDGNASQALRKVIREAAKRRGVLVESKAAADKGGRANG